MELNSEAWARWSAYRIAIKKPMRAQTEEAAKLKLMRFDKDQEAVVDQSIANGWVGLFPVTPEKTDPTAPKKRTRSQQEADTAQWDYLNRQSVKDWDKVLDSPIKRLHLCAALLARYDVESDQGSLILSEKRSALKDRVAGLLREAEAKLVIADLNLIRLVIRLFNAAGLRRLEARAEQKAAA